MRRRDVIAGLAAAPLMGAARTAPPAADFEAAWRGAVADPRQGRTDALLVLQDGQTVFERYGPDHGPDTRHVSWSIAKAVTHALVGAAVLRDLVDIDAPVSVIPENRDVTLRHLLTLTDGLPWDEDRKPLAVASDASRLLFGPGRFDGARYAASRPGARRPPGTAWNYSTGAYHLAAAELTTRLFPDLADPGLRRRRLADWAAEALFARAKFDMVLEFDPRGIFYGGSLMWATARHYAAFGRLYLDGGGGVLPDGWARFARTPTVEPTYGAGWWLEGAPGPGAGPSLLGGEPADAFHARGLDGQVLMVVPSRRLVIVRLGYTPDTGIGWPAIAGCLRRIITLSS
ncbi:MAG TPA: serine hydrolase domain-containing protein [Caulobacter sp.]|nr:serine hydrolase domain-containing protein [Caulobacter sp.]